MGRRGGPPYVVILTHGDNVVPGVFGPYSREVADEQADRLVTRLRATGEGYTGTPGEYAAHVAPIARGPIKVRSVV